MKGDRSRPSRLLIVLFGFLCVGVLVRLFAVFGDLGFVGWDTYPLIEMSRLDGSADVLDVFTTSLMGKTDGGLYYRPLPKLTFSLDYALWRLWAPGYQLTSILLLGVLAAAIYRLASELFGSGRSWGAIAAVLLVLLHPIQATVLPAPSRRPDVLAAVFMLLCLTYQIRGVRRPSMATAFGTAVLGGLALVSKETAFILPPLALLAAFLYAPGNSAIVRVRQAVIHSAPLLLVTLCMLLVRFSVLGGFVGERPMLEGDVLSAAATMSLRVARLMFSGGAIVGAPDAAPLALIIALFAAVVAGVQSNAPERAAVHRVLARPAIISLAWMVLVVATFTVGLILQPWYVLNPLVAFALLVGASVEALILLVRSSHRARITGFVAFAGLAWLWVALAAYSPVFRSYDDWTRMTDITESYLGDLRVKLASAEPDSIVRIRGTPYFLTRRTDKLVQDEQPPLIGVTGIVEYSVEAWAKLMFPERSVRVRAAATEDRPGPGEILVLVGRRPLRQGARQGR